MSCACGGASVGAKPAATATDDSPAAKCLRIADAPRTREAACLRAEEVRSKLEQGAAFVDVVKEYGDEPGAT